MKILLLGIVIIFSTSLLAQKDTIPGIALNDAKIVSRTMDTTMVGGLMLNATKYIVKSKTQVATRLTFTGIGNKYKKAKIKVAIYRLPDTNYIIRDTIYNHIERYWIEQEKWLRACPGYEDSTELRGDFSTLPIDEGFFQCGTDTVPFIQPGHGREGTYQVLYFKEHLYKIVLLESEGAGGMGFIVQNMLFTHNGIEYPFVDYASRWMDEIRMILKNK